MVISPVFGGAFPIADSCVRAFRNLGHDADLVDLRNFQARYHQLRAESESDEVAGAHFYREIQVELEQLVDAAPPDLFFSMALAPLQVSFVESLRRRGVVTASWFVEDCRRFPMWRWQAGWFDYFFLIQDAPLLDQVREAGARDVSYLSNAGEATLSELRAMSQDEQSHFGSDLCFMGAPYPNRVELFSQLADYSVGLWGRGWSEHEHLVPGMVREGERLVSSSEEASIYRSSKILINLHSSTSADDSGDAQDFLNPRTFTAALCGTFQLIDERSLLTRAFSVGKEVETFRGLDDLKEKLDYFLAHPREREAYARAAQARALREHTYEFRMAEALSKMGLETKGKLRT